MSEQPTMIDKILDVRRLRKYLSGTAEFRKGISDRIDEVERVQDQTVSQTRDMIHAHLAFLDHLTKESAAADPKRSRDLRLEFVQFYMGCAKDKRLL